MISKFSLLYIKPGSIISFNDVPDVKYEVKMCIKLEPLGGTGYQMNLVRV
jgi:hypothetical protein